jgi:hypothetical protein
MRDGVPAIYVPLKLDIIFPTQAHCVIEGSLTTQLFTDKMQLAHTSFGIGIKLEQIVFWGQRSMAPDDPRQLRGKQLT